MGKIISICSQKGGVGKTTTCVNLSAALGILENRVLVIDTDPQFNTSMSFGFSSKKLNNPALQHMDFVSVIQNNIIRTNSPNVYLLPYFEDLNFFKRTSESEKFKKSIQLISKFYDYILIDCVPFFKRNNLDILVSSDSVIIPVQCDYYALRGLNTFLKILRHIQRNLNESLDIEGFLLTMYDQRLNLSRKIVSYMHNYFKGFVFDTIIHRNSKISRAQSFGKSILEHDINSIGAKQYLELAHEIIVKNAVPRESKKVPHLPETKKIVFNEKEPIKAPNPQTDNDRLVEKITKFSEVNYEKTGHFLPNNFDTLLDLSKFQVKKILGSCYKNHYGNIWTYKINKSNIFKKKYLHLYFKNDIVSHYATKWF